uniref:Potassium channel tetramerisation-type BTB domain-containing protein n=1 Tax=Panagrolaimus sp. JU765 TaxID=591449 RepID=A0AC34QBJ4_9BILA
METQDFDLMPVTVICSGTQKIQTTKAVLRKFPESLFSKLLEEAEKTQFDENNLKIDCAERDPFLIRQIINALRHPKNEFVLPDNFHQFDELKNEIDYLNLPELADQIGQINQSDANGGTSTITVAYHGTLAFGKQGMAADVNFRKIHRILVCGKMSDCRQIFGDALNQGRDGDMGEDRYTSRVYLKHTFLEQAFDALALSGYNLISATQHTPSPSISHHHKDEQDCYMHYAQYVFQKE